MKAIEAILNRMFSNTDKFTAEKTSKKLYDIHPDVTDTFSDQEFYDIALMDETSTLWWMLKHIPAEQLPECVSIYIDNEGYSIPVIGGHKFFDFYQIPDFVQPETKKLLILLMRMGHRAFFEKKALSQLQQKEEREKISDEMENKARAAIRAMGGE